MVTVFTDEARPVTPLTDEARKGSPRESWTDFTSIAWNNVILSGIAWSDLPLFRTTVLTDEARPATTLTDEVRT